MLQPAYRPPGGLRRRALTGEVDALVVDSRQWFDDAGCNRPRCRRERAPCLQHAAQSAYTGQGIPGRHPCSVARGRRRISRDDDEDQDLQSLPKEADGLSSAERRRMRQRWAQLIKHVYEVDPLVCEKCGSRMRIISVILDPDVIKRILSLLVVWLASDYVAHWRECIPEVDSCREGWVLSRGDSRA